ncbi:MAG: imidazole glycerol phosphate synthase subunit HisH [Clostridia bacterium]|nr:imidazole glycerol phosphate synthase subunit HisH [Clostridia bacterium]
MIAIVDYGVGNLYSLRSSLKYIGVDHSVVNTAEDLRRADRIILPGVGAFEDAARKLAESGMKEALLEEAASGKPLLGICLGMQMLFDVSYEYGEHKGLGLIPGKVCPLNADIPSDLKVPHIGWNRLNILKQDKLFDGFKDGSHVYYVHSFYAKDCLEHTLATSEYGTAVTGAVRRGNVCGMQFHPEKSGSAGLALLTAFSKL